jgi:predicted metalloprotease
VHRSLLIVLALVSSVWTSAAPLVHADEMSDWRQTATNAAHDVNAFWTRTAPAYGFTYSAPRLRLLSVYTVTRSACDGDSDVDGVQDHAYCPVDSTVYLDVDSDEDHSVASLVIDERAYIVEVIVAHEAGHHIQDLMGMFDRPTAPRSIDVELQADCLSGYALAGSSHRKQIEAHLDEVARFSTEAADPAGTRATDPDAHGTPAQRNAAFLRGFTTPSGVRACGL